GARLERVLGEVAGEDVVAGVAAVVVGVDPASAELVSGVGGAGRATLHLDGGQGGQRRGARGGGHGGRRRGVAERPCGQTVGRHGGLDGLRLLDRGLRRGLRGPGRRGGLGRGGRRGRRRRRHLGRGRRRRGGRR